MSTMSSATVSPALVSGSCRGVPSAADLLPADKDAALSQFEALITALSNVGLATEVRNGEDSSVLVFCKVASEEHLYAEVYRSRCVAFLCSRAPPLYADDTVAESATGSMAFAPPSLRGRPEKLSIPSHCPRLSVYAPYTSS